MNQLIRIRWCCALFLVVTLGCGGSGDTGDVADMDDLATLLEQPEPVTQPKAADPKPNKKAERAAARRRNVEEEDKVESGGYLSAVAGAHRHIRERLDDLAWKKSVQMYQATNGNLPRDTEEFMRLAETEGTPLPRIEEGHEFFYDPSEGQFGTLYELIPEE